MASLGEISFGSLQGIVSTPMATTLGRSSWLRDVSRTENIVTTPSSLGVEIAVDNNGNLIPSPLAASANDEVLRLVVPQSWENEADERRKNRLLMQAIMDHDWLGLAILSIAREGAVDANGLLKQTGASCESLIETTAKLVSDGAVTIAPNGQFSCSDRGRNLLQNLEGAIGVDLRPDSDRMT